MLPTKRYSPQEVADIVNVHKATLIRWIKQGKVPEVNRDVRGWRFFTEEDLEKVKEYAFTVIPGNEYNQVKDYKDQQNNKKEVRS